MPKLNITALKVWLPPGRRLSIASRWMVVAAVLRLAWAERTVPSVVDVVKLAVFGRTGVLI